jgi:hypothetical protein
LEGWVLVEILNALFVGNFGVGYKKLVSEGDESMVNVSKKWEK